MSQKTENLYKNLKSQIDKISKHNRQGSFKTKERYEQSVNRFCKFIAEEFAVQKFANIQDKHIQAYITDMKNRGLSASHIKAEVSAIRFYYDKSGGKNVLGEFDTGKRKFGGVPRAWSEKEINDFKKLCEKRGATKIENISMLARNEGLRLHEAIRIDRAIAKKAVKNNTIEIKGKGGKVREVPLSAESKEMLTKLIESTSRGEKLFIQPGEKTHLFIKQVQNFINRNREHFQDKGRTSNITFHGLRHAYAQEQYNKAINSGKTALQARLKVSSLLGHGRDDVTRIYLAKE